MSHKSPPSFLYLVLALVISVLFYLSSGFCISTDEIPFILKDEEYELKYRTELKDAVQRARERPQALLSGYQVCLAPHLQPPVGTLSAIVRSAGGDVS